MARGVTRQDFLLPITPCPFIVSVTSPFQQRPFCLNLEMAQLQVRKSGAYIPMLILRDRKHLPQPAPILSSVYSGSAPYLSDNQFLSLYYKGYGQDA